MSRVFENGSSDEEESNRPPPPSREDYLVQQSRVMLERIRVADQTHTAEKIEIAVGEMVRDYSVYVFNEGELRASYKDKKSQSFDQPAQTGGASLRVNIDSSDMPNAEFLATVDVLRRWSRNVEARYKESYHGGRSINKQEHAIITLDGVDVVTNFTFYEPSQKISVFVAGASNYVYDMADIARHSKEILYLIKHGKFSPTCDAANQERVASLACLMGIEEVHRNKASLATNIMFLEKIAAQDDGFVDNLSKEKNKLTILKLSTKGYESVVGFSNILKKCEEIAKTQATQQFPNHWDKINCYAEKAVTAMQAHLLSNHAPRTLEVLNDYNMHPKGMINVSRISQQGDRRRYDRAGIAQDYAQELRLMHMRQGRLFAQSMEISGDLVLSTLLKDVHDLDRLKDFNKHITEMPQHRPVPVARCKEIIEVLRSRQDIIQLDDTQQKVLQQIGRSESREMISSHGPDMKALLQACNKHIGLLQTQIEDSSKISAVTRSCIDFYDQHILRDSYGLTSPLSTELSLRSAQDLHTTANQPAISFQEGAQPERPDLPRYYGGDEFTRLFSDPPLIPYNSEGQLQGAFANVASGQNSDTIILNVNALDHTPSDGSSNHWVGIVVNRDDNTALYIDPMGYPPSTAVIERIQGQIGRDGQITNLYDVECHPQRHSIVDHGEDVPEIKGNHHDCGPYLVDALNYLRSSERNIESSIVELQKLASAIPDVDASIRFGQRLRTHHSQLRESNTQVDEEIVSTNERVLAATPPPLFQPLSPSQDIDPSLELGHASSTSPLLVAKRPKLDSLLDPSAMIEKESKKGITVIDSSLQGNHSLPYSSHMRTVTTTQAVNSTEKASTEVIMHGCLVGELSAIKDAVESFRPSSTSSYQGISEASGRPISSDNISGGDKRKRSSSLPPL